MERIVSFLLEVAPSSAQDAVENITGAVTILGLHPRIGRRVRRHIRELVISHGGSGYLALYRYDPQRSLVRVLRVRHQREAGYRD